jgi:hypothetical protein
MLNPEPFVIGSELMLPAEMIGHVAEGDAHLRCIAAMLVLRMVGMGIIWFIYGV